MGCSVKSENKLIMYTINRTGKGQTFMKVNMMQMVTERYFSFLGWLKSAILIYSIILDSTNPFTTYTHLVRQ